MCVPSLLGSFCFTFASYVYLLEVAVDADAPWVPPPTLRGEWAFPPRGALVGSVLYTVSSAFTLRITSRVRTSSC